MKKEVTIAWSYILLFILYSLTAIVYNLINETAELICMRIAAALINSMGVTLLSIMGIWLVKRLTNISLLTPLLILNAAVALVECFLLANFYSLITPSTLFVLIGTNRNEAAEFFHSYFTIPIWFLLTSFLFILFIGWKHRKCTFSLRLPEWMTTKWMKMALLFSILSVYGGLNYYVRCVRYMTSFQMLTGIERVWHSVQITQRDVKEYQKYLNLVQQAPSISLTKNESTIPYIVLIIGESTSKWHMQAYGYQRQTTPRLMERLEKQETVLFTDVETSHTVTYAAIPDIMTFHTSADEKKWYEYPTLPQIMRSAGYHTIWISNQDSFTFGPDNSTVSIANSADVTLFTYQRHASEERYGYFDEAILPLLKGQIQGNESKQFFCLHLMGCHRRYTNRYPSSFAIFTPSDNHNLTNYNQQKTIAEYDNCVLYTDFICNEIIKLFEDKDALVLYFSDHGEEVYDTRNMCGHTPQNPTPPMVQVPLWIWTSRQFKENHPVTQKRIENSKKTPFNTTHTPYTLMDICDLESMEYDEKKSLLYQSQ